MSTMKPTTTTFIERKDPRDAIEVKDGDRIQVLAWGGNWLWGHAEADENGVLWVVLDKGKRWIMNQKRYIRVMPKIAQLNLFDSVNNDTPVIEKTPSPIIPPATKATAFNIGDRVRVAIAKHPLTDWLGEEGTVVNVQVFPPNDFTLCSVEFAGASQLKVFEPESLEICPTVDKSNAVDNSICQLNGLEDLNMSTVLDDRQLHVGARVRHKFRWPGKTGRIGKIEIHFGAPLAFLDFGYNNLYPAFLTDLEAEFI